MRVILGDDYYIGPEWYDYTENSTPRPEEVFDIPQEQRDRWQAAIDTCEAMQEEIRALLEARLLSISP